MEKLKINIEKLSEAAFSNILGILDLKTKNADLIIEKFLSYDGIDRVLSSLSEPELELFTFILMSDNGATFSAIEKQFSNRNIDYNQLIDSLGDKSLVHILKNRKHLNNKLDKVYIFDQIQQKIRQDTGSALKSRIEETIREIINGPHPSQKQKLSETEADVIKELYSSSGIVSLKEMSKRINSSVLDKTLDRLLTEGLISIFHIVTYPFSTLIILNSKGFDEAISRSKAAQSKDTDNKYLLLNNIFQVHDVISEFGLFITQQKIFRKIDKKRISDAIIPMAGFDNENIDQDDTVQFIFNLLSLVESLQLKKDSVIINLSKFKPMFDNPDKLLSFIISKLDPDKKVDPIFQSTQPLPGNEAVNNMKIFLANFGQIPEHIFESCYFFNEISNNPKFLNNFEANKAEVLKLFKNTEKFFIIAGLTELKNGMVSLSDISNKVFNIKKETAETNKVEADNRSVYINSDFSMIIPKEDVTPDALYIIMSFTELQKNDIIINSKITKESVLKAHKRGMSVDSFIQALTEYSKNEIPQNLSFLLKEWIDQALVVRIGYSLLLKTNHSSFIDDLLYSNLKSGILERINGNYAIIDREYLDRIINYAHKAKVMLSITGDMKDEM